MGVSDDLAPLFDPEAPGVRMRQGLLTDFNASTGGNSVLVGGATLTNVPMLNTGEAIALKAGHVVVLLGQGASWFIIGRVTPVGDANFAAASVAFGSAGAQNLGAWAPTVLGTVVCTTSELVVPDWADEAIVMIAGNASAQNTSGANGFLAYEVGCNGGGGGAIAVLATPGATVGVGASSRNRFTGLSGGETLTVTGTATIGVGTWPSGGVAAFVHAIAVYKSNI
jgi:hypothetical protein